MSSLLRFTSQSVVQHQLTSLLFKVLLNSNQQLITSSIQEFSNYIILWNKKKTLTTLSLLISNLNSSKYVVMFSFVYVHFVFRLNALCSWKKMQIIFLNLYTSRLFCFCFCFSIWLCFCFCFFLLLRLLLLRYPIFFCS